LINGDISNGSPSRLIVVIDAVASSEIETSRKFLKEVTTRGPIQLNLPALSQLWRLGNKYPLSIEVAAFGDELWEQSHLDQLMGRLDRRGGNPFNYAELYPTMREFIEDIPYRNNLQGVVDLRERVARYGSYGLELFNLN
jgi:hypothetical protein